MSNKSTIFISKKRHRVMSEELSN